MKEFQKIPIPIPIPMVLSKISKLLQTVYVSILSVFWVASLMVWRIYFSMDLSKISHLPLTAGNHFPVIDTTGEKYILM